MPTLPEQEKPNVAPSTPVDFTPPPVRRPVRSPGRVPQIGQAAKPEIPTAAVEQSPAAPPPAKRPTMARREPVIHLYSTEAEVQPQPRPQPQSVPQPKPQPRPQPQSVPQQQPRPQSVPQAQPKPITHTHSQAGRRKSTRPSAGRVAWLIIRRTLIVLLTVVLLVVVGVLGLCYTLVNGPSPTIRNQLVLTAMQTSAMKWAPGLFMSDAEVAQIVADSHVVRQEEISLDEFAPPVKVDEAGQPVDEWANAIDGMRYETISGPTFKGYVLFVRDPSRVYVSTSSDFKTPQPGMQIFEGADRDGAVAAINGGEFWDDGGGGNGGQPLGLTYSNGKRVYQDWSTRTFIGIDKDDRLVVAESMTAAQADALGIRDAVSFQNGNTLITHEGDKVTLHYNDDNTGKAQRTAIGQRADGTIIMVVTDGRTAASLGATHNDIIDVMAGYGAVTAGMLDGGSSAMMYYRDWYTKYNVDPATLDENQRRGMVNKFKAFTPPRDIPTYFMVKPEEVTA